MSQTYQKKKSVQFDITNIIQFIPSMTKQHLNVFK